jgi:hypothetical protein
MDTLTITLPGVAYYECFDPLASGMAAELGLPEPTMTRAGKGWRFSYEGVASEQARAVADHLIGMGQLWLNNSDPEFEQAERGRYRTLIKTGEKLLEQVR